MTTEFKEYANYYHQLGLNVTCISNKKTIYNANSKRYKSPCHSTNHLLVQRQDANELQSYDWDNAIGVGTMAGQKIILNGKEYKLVVLDFDGIESSELENVLRVLRLPKNYEWVISTGSKLGFHIIILLNSDNVLYNAKKDIIASMQRMLGEPSVYFDRLEILLKSHVVLPPSIHGSTFSYDFYYCDLPQSMPKILDCDDMYFFLDECCHSQPTQVLSGVYLPLPYEERSLVQQNSVQLENIKALVLDIETDGLIQNNSYPNILQIAWYCLDTNNDILKKEAFSIKTNLSENKAFSINKLDIDKLNFIGYDLEEVFKWLSVYLRYCNIGICYNKKFDLSILNHYLIKLGYSNTFNIEKSICLLEQYAISFNDSEFVNLETAYSNLCSNSSGITKSHNAEIDVYKTNKLYCAMLSKLSSKN